MRISDFGMGLGSNFGHPHTISFPRYTISFPRSAWERIPSDALRLERNNLYWTQSVQRFGPALAQGT